MIIFLYLDRIVRRWSQTRVRGPGPLQRNCLTSTRGTCRPLTEEIKLLRSYLISKASYGGHCSLRTDEPGFFKPIFQVKSGKEVSLTLIINDQTLEVRLIGIIN